MNNTSSEACFFVDSQPEETLSLLHKPYSSTLALAPNHPCTLKPTHYSPKPQTHTLRPNPKHLQTPIATPKPHRPRPKPRSHENPDSTHSSHQNTPSPKEARTPEPSGGPGEDPAFMVVCGFRRFKPAAGLKQNGERCRASLRQARREVGIERTSRGWWSLLA